MAGKNANRQADKAGSRFLCFFLGPEEFAIPLLSVKEVIAVPELRPMPFSPQHFLGIMNLRGDIIPVVDLRRKLEIQPLERASENAVIICDLGPHQSLGLKVDSINYVLALTEKEITASPGAPGDHLRAFVCGVFKREKALVLLLDVTKILDSTDRESINRSVNANYAA